MTAQVKHGRGLAIGITNCDDFLPVETLHELLTPHAGTPNRIFRHDPDLWARMTPEGLERGVNVFGDSDSRAMLAKPDSKTLMRSAYSCALDGGVFLPKSTALLTGDGRMIEPSIQNAAYWGGIENVELDIRRTEFGLVTDWQPAELLQVDVCAISPLGIGHQNYGHFLFDGLPLAYLIMNAEGRSQSLVMATPPLADWQREIFALLGLSQNVVEIIERTRFRTLVGNSHLSMHISYTTRYCRPVLDALRFAVSYQADAPEKIFILRPAGSNRAMRNPEAVAKFMRARGYALVQPERHPVREQIRIFSKAKVIVGETGAALANAAFAPLGAKLLEIMPECYIDQWTRSVTHIMGHRWHVLFARVREEDKIGLQAGTAFHGNAGFSFDLELSHLASALDAMDA